MATNAWIKNSQPSVQRHLIVVVVQLLSHVQLFVTPWTAACQASLSFTISWSLLKLVSIESYPLSSPSPSAFNLSQNPGLFQSVLPIRWPKYWSFSSSISPSNEYSELISLGLTGLILQSKGLSRVFSNTTVQKHHLRTWWDTNLWGDPVSHWWLVNCI